MALFLGPASPAPYGPTTRHGTRFPGPHATTSRVTSPHQGHAPCSRYDSASLITAHPLTTSWHVPSFQAGPSAPALTRMARTPPSRPPPDPAGPSARSGLGWARTHLGPPVTPHGPAPRGTAGPNASRTPGQATRKANCGRAEAAPSRCRRVRPGCHNDRAGCCSEPGSKSCSTTPSPDHSSLVAPQPPRSTRGHLDSAESSAGGEGLPQTTPLLSRRGCKWGSNPLSSMNNQPTKIVSCLAPNTTSRDTPEGGSSSSRGCERRSLRWLLNFRLDMVWDAETTRNLAELPPDNQGAYRGLLQCPT
jgi:hypothetical protein